MSARVFNKEQITSLMSLTSDYDVKRIEPQLFLQSFARAINAFGETAISNEDRSKLVKDLKALYPLTFDTTKTPQL